MSKTKKDFPYRRDFPSKKEITSSDLTARGNPRWPKDITPLNLALKMANTALAWEHMYRRDIIACLRQMAAAPDEARASLQPLARALRAAKPEDQIWREREHPALSRRWGEIESDPVAVNQMAQACRLPQAVRGALMPDVHLGNGLPVGGVLAVKNAIIPNAVGMDIACRMRLTVLDWPAAGLTERRDELRAALEKETRFGTGATFEPEKKHEVMDEDWSVSPITARQKDWAWKQLGTSGGGNHFVEFGELSLPAPDLGLPAGNYLALLSHSGSRSAGEAVTEHYSRLAMYLHPVLPREIKPLAWLEADSQLGREYWGAMKLMGRYAAANHELIHRHILAALGAEALATVENHHNFAWREDHEGQKVIVHRKGAISAAQGRLGFISGSMGAPGFVVRGRGCPEALFSCSHGAGRRLNRVTALKTLDRATVSAYLAERGVELISGGLDEAPMAYKDIEAVMAAQADLVDIVARFEPRLVKMAPVKMRPAPKSFS